MYGDKVRIVWKHFPLDMHQDAPLAALASMAALEQGKFWEFHDKVFASQPNIQRQYLVQYAKDLGIDAKRFEAAIAGSHGKPAIDADVAEAKTLGVTGTPAFFINGHFLSGSRPFDDFAQVINSELSRLGVPIPPAAAGRALPPARKS